MKKETGIEGKELVPIYRIVSKNTIYYGYLCETQCDKDSIKLQEGENIGYLWLKEEDFFKFLNRDNYVQTHKGDWRNTYI